MALCKICFQEVQEGVAVPGYREASGMVHEECLAAVVLKFAEDPQVCRSSNSRVRLARGFARGLIGRW